MKLPLNNLQSLLIPHLNHTKKNTLAFFPSSQTSRVRAEEVLSKGIRPDIKPPIGISISIILIFFPSLGIDILFDIECPTYFCKGNENGICSEMFAWTNSSTPTEGGGWFFGGGERFCVTELGVVEEATGFEGMGVGVIDFWMIDCPGKKLAQMVGKKRGKRGRGTISFLGWWFL